MMTVTLNMADNIATITINNGKVNVISPQVIAEINSALDQAVQQKAIVILTEKAGILSGGYDLNTIKISSDSAVALVTSGYWHDYALRWH